MKKIAIAASIILATAITTFSLNSALASNNSNKLPVAKSNTPLKLSSSNTEITKAKVIQIFKDKFHLLFNSYFDDKSNNIIASYNEDDMYMAPYWNINAQNPFIKSDSIDCSIDAKTGIIQAFNAASENNYQKIKQPMLTFDDAKKRALNALNIINPALKEYVKLVPLYNNSYNPTAYNFIFQHVFKGLPVGNDTISIVINCNSGLLMSYYASWHDFSIRPSATIGSKAIASDTYGKLLNPILSYKPIMGKMRLTYSPSFGCGKLVASDGKTILDTNGNTLKKADITTRDLTVSMKNKIYSSFKKQTLKVYDSEYAKKAALSFAKNFLKGNYSVEQVNSESSRNLNNQTNTEWNILLGDQNSLNGNVRISVDQNNGQINSVADMISNIAILKNNSNTKKSVNPKSTWSQAYDKAIKIISYLYPQYINEINTKQSNDYSDDSYLYLINASQGDNPSEYYFNFERMHNGVPCRSVAANGGDGIAVTINSSTGDPENLGITWTNNLVFSSLKPVITKEQAKNIFLKNCEPALKYEFLGNKRNAIRSNKIKFNAALVYELNYKLNNQTYQTNPFGFIDAESMKLYDNSGVEIKTAKGIAKSSGISSQLQRQIQFFSDMNLFNQKMYDINKPISKGDALSLLMQIKGITNEFLMYRTLPDIKYTDVAKDNSAYAYLAYAIKDGIIKDEKAKFSPDLPLTKSEMAEWIVNAMDSQDIESIKDILNIKFSKENETSDNYKSCIDIFTGLHLSSDKVFNEKDTVTVGEMIGVLYNAMKYMSLDSM